MVKDSSKVKKNYKKYKVCQKFKIGNTILITIPISEKVNDSLILFFYGK
jgi:hypothetical protein